MEIPILLRLHLYIETVLLLMCHIVNGTVTDIKVPHCKISMQLMAPGWPYSKWHQASSPCSKWHQASPCNKWHQASPYSMWWLIIIWRSLLTWRCPAWLRCRNTNNYWMETSSWKSVIQSADMTYISHGGTWRKFHMVHLGPDSI